MSIFPSSLTGRLLLVEVVLLTLIAVIALWVTTESVRYADQTRTMWPSLLLEYSPSFVSVRALLVVVAIAVVYFGLKRSGRGTLAFWAFTALALGSQVPDLWAHNRIDWHRFFDRVAYFSEPLPLATSAAIFLLMLAGLVALHRIIQLRELGGRMNMRGVDDTERDAVIRNEVISIGATIVVSLLLASVMVVVAALVGRSETISGLVPWTVATVGVVATLLLAGFLLFLYRGLSGGEAPPSSGDVDAEGSPDEDAPAYQ